MTSPSSFPEPELEWFKRVVNFRMLSCYPEQEREQVLSALPESEQDMLRVAADLRELTPPELSGDKSPYAALISNYAFNFYERFTLLLALVPHLRPKLLNVFHGNSRQSQYGGLWNENTRTFMPTAETLLFVLAGDDMTIRFGLLALFEEEHLFHRANILSLGAVAANEPLQNGILNVSREITDVVTRGNVRPPDFGNDFPAKRITTQMTWQDLVLAPVTQRQVEEVKIWVRNREKLITELGLGKRMKPGYKILFHGAPGTGKTLTACLLGQYTGKHVFRIDLSMVVSKYIGETEKNLAKVFDKAEHADWILFFDEADALFGSRTKVSSSHDRYANQEVSYLLQRIEDYNGIVILASNMKSNIDDAFMRRFSSVVHFPFPKSEERLQLWRKALPEKLSLATDVDVRKLADRYEMSGANITNIIAWCALMALEKGDLMVTDAMLREGMARELAKEGRTL